METQKMVRCLFIVNAKNKVVTLMAFPGEKNFNGIVDVPAFGKKF